MPSKNDIEVHSNLRSCNARSNTIFSSPSVETPSGARSYFARLFFIKTFQKIGNFLRAKHDVCFDVVADEVDGVERVHEDAHNTTKILTYDATIHAKFVRCKFEIIREEDDNFEQDKKEKENEDIGTNDPIVVISIDLSDDIHMSIRLLMVSGCTANGRRQGKRADCIVSSATACFSGSTSRLWRTGASTSATLAAGTGTLARPWWALGFF